MEKTNNKKYKYLISTDERGYKKYGYVSEDELNEEEKKYKSASFLRVWKETIRDSILCNDIIKEMEARDIYDVVRIDNYEEDDDGYVDEFQYFIVEFDNWFGETEEEKKQIVDKLGCTLYYIKSLDVYVIGITHYGTSWDYVSTDTKLKIHKEEWEK